MIGFRKPLILIHRYLGIVLSLVFIVWFISGIGMIYARGMPRLTPQTRLERLAAVDLDRVRLAPAEAAEAAGLSRTSGRAVLLSVMDRPAYRFGNTTVFADTGEIMSEVGPSQAKAIAGHFLNVPEDQAQYVDRIIQADQWTVGVRSQLPVHKIQVNDDARTELYISPQTGDIVVLTTRASRALAWVAAIPHWFYFTSLRTNDQLWRTVVLWTAGLGCVLALIGIVVGVMQMRRSRPHIPYTGWMRWHHITGLVFGVLTLTWVFSGMLSMEPWGWASGQSLEVDRQAFTGGAVDLSLFPAMDPVAWKQLSPERPIKEVEFTRIQGDPYYVVRTAPEGGSAPSAAPRQEYGVMARADPESLLVAAEPLRLRREPFSVDSLMSRLRQAVPDVPILESELLSDYDSYYYSRDRQAPLPILRVKFDDPEQTWVYLDPQRGQLVGQLHRLDRVERWIYNGFHSLDFAFWYYNPPLWQFGIIVLSLGGIASSGIGMFIGFRRLWRGVRRTVRPVAGTEVRSGSGTSDWPSRK